MGGTKYGPIFLVCVIVGGILIFVGPAGLISGKMFIDYGMKGLLVEQQIVKQEFEFKREVSLQELAERHREAEFERQLRLLRLQRPSTPDEAY